MESDVPSFFRHIDPSSPLTPLNGYMLELSQSSTTAHQAISEAQDLAHAAMTFFRGVFPIESPYFCWGEGIYLPWHADYWEETREGGSRAKAIPLPEINAIAEEICSVGRRESHGEPFLHLTYLSAILCASNQLKVQGLAIEAVMCLEGYLERIANNQATESVPWLSAAFKNIIEATVEVQQLVSAMQQSVVDA